MDVVQIREKRVNDLSSAIEDIASSARSAEPKDRLRFCQLLGFLRMVLDGTLNNVAKGELLKRLDQVEAEQLGGCASSRAG